jgi:hypothetical protein
MRFLYTLFLSLCIHVVGSSTVASTGRDSVGVFVNSAHEVESSQIAIAGSSQQHILNPAADVSENNPYFIAAEDETEEELSIKHNLPARNFLAFYYAFIVSHPCRELTSLFVCRPASHPRSCKYIEQRVLRI